MGANLLVSFVSINIMKNPDWEAGLRYVAELALKKADDWPRSYTTDIGRELPFDTKSEATELREELDRFRDAFDNINRRDTAFLDICHKVVFLSARMSDGDSPSESYELIDRLVNAGVTEACGFDF